MVRWVGSMNASIGKFEIQSRLGRGRMADVYRCSRKGIGGFEKVVVVKCIRSERAGDPEFVRLFLDEARLAANLNHPNIVQLFEIDEVNGTPYIAMEYVPGPTLAALLHEAQRAQRRDCGHACKILAGVCEGLHYAHTATSPTGAPLGLVHRDVNPANLFVTYEGVVKLLDFGIVKNPSGGQRTAPGIFKGTYGYCAPEQVVGGAVDRQTDVFCLGIVFWELLTGRRLFDDGNQVSTIDAVRSRKIQAPSVLRPEVPREVDAVVLRALDRDRRGRFVSAHQLVGELRAMSRQLPMPASKELGAWLQQLVGAERVACKRAVGQGREVEAALARLAALSPPPSSSSSSSSSGSNSHGSGPKAPSLVEPRAIWSTQLPARPSSEARRAVPRTPAMMAVAPAEGRPPARRRLLAVGALGLVAVAGIAFLALRTTAPRAATAQPLATGALTIRSRPAGAHILVDGNPSGLFTPATLPLLPTGRSVEVRLDKSGYGPVSRTIAVQPGSSTHDFELAEANGTIRIESLPANATIFVDDTAVEGRGPLSVAIGPHRLRVETPGDVLFTGELEVQRGEQTVRLAPSRKGP